MVYQHDRCHRPWPDAYEGPARLVAIGMRDTSLWRLCEVGEEDVEHLNYFTLSHCWGKVPLFHLNSSTLKVTKLGMPISALPRTFQDAMQVARKLGASCIW